jgi:NitT/TauT family transport system substrate-binding protein
MVGLVKLKAAAAALSTLLALGMAQEGNAQGRKFVVTQPVHAVDSLPFYIGIRKGFFKEAGLDISLVTSEGGGQHIAAVLAGSADAFIGGPEHIAFAKVKGGAPMRAVVSMSNRVNAFLVASTKTDITQGASLGKNLKGKRIATGTRGTTTHSLMLALLKREGLNPREDVVLLEISAAAGRMAAVGSGQADIAMVAEPFIIQGVKAGFWKEPIASLPKEIGPFAWTTINVPLKLIESDPKLVQGMVDAMRKALEFSFTNPAEVEAIAKAEFPTLPQDELKAILSRTVENDLWQRDGAMPTEAWEKTMRLVQEIGLLKEDVAYKDVFEPKFLKK